MLRAILNKSWQQHPTRHQLYGHLPPIMKTIQVRRTRHAGHCWRSKDKLVSDVLLWTPTYDQAKAGWPAQTYIQQLCEDTQDVSLKTSRRQWMIGRSGKRWSGISVLVARHDDDDDKNESFYYSTFRRCPHGVMVKAMDCGIVVREFKLQSCYYVHFRANTLGKGMNPLILPAMG